MRGRSPKEGRRLVAERVNASGFSVFVLGMVVLVAVTGPQSTEPFLQIVLVAIAIAGLSRISVIAPSGHNRYLSDGMALAVPLAFELDPGGAFAAIGAGYLGSLALTVGMGTTIHRALASHVRRVVAVMGYAIVLILLGSWIAENLIVVAIGVAAAVWYFVDLGLWMLGREHRHLSFHYLGRVAGRDWQAAALLAGSAAMVGLIVPALTSGWIIALLVVGAPFLTAYFAFHRYREVRRTYGQTIRALARIPEVAGLSPLGHSDRVSALAVDVATDLGMTPDEVEEVEFAAMLHDIGRITLNEPSIIRMGYTEADLARWGAEVIAEAEYLAAVADHVRNQHQPYRQPGQNRDMSLSMASKIIKSASAYDHAVYELGYGTLEALEVLHRGAAYDYDPDVVTSIRRVVLA